MFSLKLLAFASACCFAAAYNGARVIGGTEARIEDGPWQLSLRKGGSHICGASLIAPDWAVTAAHCVDGDTSTLSIGYGHADKRQHSSVGVTGVTQHEGWGGANSAVPFPDDIAVLKLASKITLGDTVNTIPLATDANIDNWAACYIKGWGVFDYDYMFGIEHPIFKQPVLPDILQKATISKISLDTCKANYGMDLPNTNVCVYEGHAEAASACSGDSGGPLVCEQGGIEVLVGATSWGAADCEGYPSVYTRISSYRNWIAQKTGLSV